MSNKNITDLNEFLDLTIEEIFADRFARYSKYIIQDRALPDVRDGLKPVQRRVVYSMNKEGNRFDRQFRKSAKTVGNVIGNYHPHGDTSVYDAMVRMSQTWKVNEQLVLMHGNNGSIDGDSAAAMRYTEAKMSEYAQMMIVDIDEDTVNKIPNFDDTELEPTVLPTRVPNLLINGSSGISSGYATDIPPHNATEIINACILLLKKPRATVEEIMEIVPGPDFPTGATIQGVEGIKQAYKTGSGKISIKSNVEIRKNDIVITAIPYAVNKSTLLQKIDIIRIDKKIEGIKEVVDQSDQSGLEIWVHCNRDANVEAILSYLLKNTDLQRNYSFNMIAINNRRPQKMGIIPILKAFLEHRVDVITRRSEYRLKKANARLHILDGLIIAVMNLAEVVQIIQKSSDKADSKINLINRFRFSEDQAEAVVMMQLYRLSNTDITNLENNVSELKAEVDVLNEILSNEKVLKKLIISELKESLTKLKKPRKTIVEAKIEEIKINQKDLIKAEKMIVSITRNGYIKRSNPRSYVASQELSSCATDDMTVNNLLTNTRYNVLVFFNDGSYANIPVNDIPETKWKDLGRHISSICKINDGVSVVSMVSVEDLNNYKYLVSVSKLGYYTRVLFSDLNSPKLKQKIQWQKTKANDEIVSVVATDHDDLDTIFITNLGRYVKYNVNDLELTATKRVGFKLINLRKEEEFKFNSYMNCNFAIFTDRGSYVKFRNKDLVNTIKPLVLYTNIKSEPHNIISLINLTTTDILLKDLGDEYMISTKELKNCSVEDRIKSVVKSNTIYTVENLIDIN